MGRRVENGSTDSVGTSERGDRVRFWLVVSVERGDETAAEVIVVSKKRRVGRMPCRGGQFCILILGKKPTDLGDEDPGIWYLQLLDPYVHIAQRYRVF